MKNANIPLVIARAALLLMRANGTTEPLTYTSPQGEKDEQGLRTTLTTLQAAVGSYIEVVAVPRDDAPFHTLCRAYNRAETRRLSSPWPGSSPAKT
jgi:hypothetical protein